MARRRTAVLLTVGVLIGVVAAGSAYASGGEPRSPGIPASARAALRKAAIAIATLYGDGHPYDIEAVRTTHREAERILCGECESKLVPPGAPVYAVAMRGHFHCDSCSPPRDVTIGPATVLTSELLVSSLRSLEVGYGGRYPRLTAAGTPVRL
jgi:hypothetical protein